MAHELAFVLAPGALVYAVLRPNRPGLLQSAAVGYAVGSVLEILAFALTAALHVRGALWAYPPVVIVLGLIVLRRRGRLGSAQAGPAWGGGPAWALAGLCVVTTGYVAVAYFLFEPLPSRAGSVVYIPDLVFHLGVAADALHHWPISDPKVSGVALPYENFIYMKLAATSQLTHIPLPTLLFRLYVLPLVLSAAALIACAGAIVTRRRVVGVLAAALFLLVGQLGLDSHDPLVFANTVFISLYDSPSYLLGLVLFMAALIVLYEQLVSERSPPALGWVLLTLLLVGCAGAKATILPVLLGGLGLYVLWTRLDRRAAWALALTAAVFVATYWLIYHGEGGGLHANPPGSIRLMSAIQYGDMRFGGSIGHPLFWVGASIVGLVGFCGATLAGIPAVLTSKLRRARSTVLLLALLLASLVPFFTFSHKGGSQNFFAYYGIAAGCLISAQGLSMLWDRVRPLGRSTVRLLGAAGVFWLALLLAAAIVPYEIANHPRLGPLYAVWIGLPAVVVAGLWIAARRASARRGILCLSAVGALLLVGVLDTPLHTLHFLVSALRIRSTPYARDAPQARGLTPDLQQALGWIRGHTPVDTVIAVNNQFSDSARRSPDYYYYSAFSERHIFLEGWEDTIPAAAQTNPALTPFPDRLRLNDAVFTVAYPGALSVLEHSYGVRYLLVDRLHGPVAPGLGRLARVVFSNPGVSVYQLP